MDRAEIVGVAGDERLSRSHGGDEAIRRFEGSPLLRCSGPDRGRGAIIVGAGYDLMVLPEPGQHSLQLSRRPFHLKAVHDLIDRHAGETENRVFTGVLRRAAGDDRVMPLEVFRQDVGIENASVHYRANGWSFEGRRRSA